jgi:hypothetical protein
LRTTFGAYASFWRPHETSMVSDACKTTTMDQPTFSRLPIAKSAPACSGRRPG